MVLGGHRIGPLLLLQGHSPLSYVLGVMILGIGLNYLPLFCAALKLSPRGRLEAELDGVNKMAELHRYTVLQFWLVVPFLGLYWRIVQGMWRRPGVQRSTAPRSLLSATRCIPSSESAILSAESPSDDDEIQAHLEWLVAERHIAQEILGAVNLPGLISSSVAQFRDGVADPHGAGLDDPRVHAAKS